MSSKWVYALGGLAVGVLFAAKIKSLPLVSKIPGF